MFYSDTKTFELEHVHIRLVPLNYLALIIDTNLSLNFMPPEVLQHSRKSKPLDKFELRTYNDHRM